ncbi:MAG: sodium-dependent transporter [Ectothiorhodospiraceae bacterium]|nr:sodium-dependent transporter [Ectothiorhodospiraceae bacterium]
MPVPRRSLQGEWPGLASFVLALAGACIGLGAIWRFPALVGEYGGGAFLLAYTVCLLLLALPLLLAEMVVGRAGRQNAISSHGDLALLHGHSPHWAWVGRLTLLTGLLLLLLLMVFGGWSLGYTFRAVTGALGQLDAIDAAALFRGLQGDMERSLLWVTVFITTVVALVSQGVARGLLPGMLALVLLLFTGLAILTWAVPPMAGGDRFAAVLEADFSRLSREAWLTALQHAFYTLAVATGVIVTFSAYLPERISVVQAGLLVLVLDLAAAALASVVVLNLLEYAGLPLVSGPALVFQVLPVALGQWFGGSVAASLFYLVLSLAALSSGVALMEAGTVALAERHGMGRGQASILIGLSLWFLALLVVLGQAQAWSLPGTLSLLDLLSALIARLLLPLGALGLLVYAGWLLAQETVRLSLGLPTGWGFHLWYGLLRWCAPVLLVVVILVNLGLIG